MNTKFKLVAYKTTSGKVPFFDWLDAFKDKITRARINRQLERLAEGNCGDFKSVGEGVFEIRLHFGAGYRIYFGKVDDNIVLLLSGGDKNTQDRDIKIAKQYWLTFKTKVKV